MGVDPYPGTAIFRRKKNQYGPRNIRGRHPTINRQSAEAINPGMLGISSSLGERQGRVLPRENMAPWHLSLSLQPAAAEDQFLLC